MAKKRTGMGGGGDKIGTTRRRRPKLEVSSRAARPRPAAGAPAAASPAKRKTARTVPPPAKPARDVAAERTPGAPPAPKRATKSRRPAATPDRDERSKRIAIAIARAALDRKALHVEVIDVRGKVDYADFVVVMSGRSDRQVGALAKNVREELETKEKVRCLGVEGLPQASWVLMDFGDVVVHVFHEDTRGYYDLEALWIDAARVSVDDLDA